MIGRLFAALAVLLVATATGHAQQTRDTPSEPGASAPRVRSSVAGRVVRPGPTEVLPVAGVWATLHRVGQDRAGPLDSVRTDARGQYAFTYTPTGSESAIYFVSAFYGGIAYFTSPLHSGAVTGDEAEITVFDTTSAAIPIRVRGRHLVVSSADANARRSIVEVYELSNDTTVTRVSGTGERATWSALLPPSARDFEVAQGDIPPEAVKFADGRALVFAPMPPGIKQLAFSYNVSAKDFPLSVPLQDSTTVFEVLLEDSTGTATGARLARTDPVTIEGRRFRRFLGQDVPASAVAMVTIPRSRIPARGTFITAILATVVVAMGAAILVAVARARRGRGVPRPVEALSDADRLARAIGELDIEFERTPRPTDDERARYEERRAELKRALAVALARREGGR